MATTSLPATSSTFSPDTSRRLVRRTIDSTLASLTLDAFLLARFARPGDGRPTGRAWEKAVSGLLWRPGFSRRQHAGMLGLFGRGSASGARHELDGAGQGYEIAAWIEAKACTVLDKTHVAVFHVKCFDLFRSAAAEHPEAIGSARWWPVLVSSEPAAEAARRVCCDLGIVLCDPQRIPLPALLHAAAKPNADDYLSEATLGRAGHPRRAGLRPHAATVAGRRRAPSPKHRPRPPVGAEDR